MEKIPMEWVDRLFICMTEFYGDKWTNQLKNSLDQNFVKSMWQSGLTGLSYSEIKQTLIYYKWMAKHHPEQKPPHQMEFFRAAKTKHEFSVPIHSQKNESNPEVAKDALAKIKQSLGLKVLCETMS